MTGISRGLDRRWVLLLLVAVIAAGVAFALSRPAAASPGPVQKQSVSTVSKPSKAAHTVADHIAKFAPEAFAGLEVHADEALVVSYWRGAVPADVRAYAQNKHHGVTVQTIGDAPFSRAELVAASARLMASPVALRVGVSSISARSTGVGLDISVSGGTPSATDQAAVAAAAEVPSSAIRYQARDKVVELPATIVKH